MKGFSKNTAWRKSTKEHAQTKNCKKCGYQHGFGECRAIKAKCNLCHKIGHYAKVCRQNKIRIINKETSDESETELCLGAINKICKVNSSSNDNEFDIEMFINNKSITFKLDTGAMANIISLHKLNT